MSFPDIATALGSAVAPTAVNFATAMGRKKYDEFIALYTNAFNDFLRVTHEKCCQVKTLLNQEAAVNLLDIYVNSRLSYQSGQPFEDITVLENVKSGSHNIAITGLAGSGKSMLMRWLSVSLIDSLINHQKIPLFIEIRDLDLDADKFELDRMIFDYCWNPLSNRNIEQFRRSLKEGIFVILLDGIDEIPPEKISPFLRALSKFVDAYGKCSTVASARPGTQLVHLSKFFVYRVEPLDLPKVVEVLEKAPYDNARKQILIKALKSGLYDTHTSFLSNPLLVTITLITFDDASRIPDNLTGFYAAAFDALFTKHDWSKGVFTRKRYSGLEKTDFEKVFQYFCYQSYFTSSYSFSRDEVLEILAKSITLADVETSPDAYLKDCIVSVCLLMLEEPKITFVHRSFQEFFTARFVAGYMGEKAGALIEWLASRNSIDNTFVMAAQLNRELVVRHWGLPRAIELYDLFAKWLDEGKALAILEFTGLTDIGCDLRTGDVTTFSGAETPGFGVLRAIYTLANEAPSVGFHFEFFANAYGGKAFADLDKPLQSLIRSLTDSNQIVRLKTKGLPDTPEAVAITASLAEGELRSLERAISKLKEYLKCRDAIADLVNIVEPDRRSRRKHKHIVMLNR